MEAGETWAYRARQQDAVTPVRVLKLGTARPPRLKVKFLDDQFEGREDWVSPARLKVLWDERGPWVAKDKRWRTARDAYDGDESLDNAVMLVLDYVVNDWNVAHERGGRHRGLLFITDLPALAGRLQLKPADLLGHPATFQRNDGTYVAPWPTTLLVASRATALNTDLVLRAMHRDERREAQEAIHGHAYRGGRGGAGHYIEPEICAEAATTWQAARTIIRKWCGAGAIAHDEELIALRVAVRRLGTLAETAISTLETLGHTREAGRLGHQLVSIHGPDHEAPRRQSNAGATSPPSGTAVAAP